MARAKKPAEEKGPVQRIEAFGEEAIMHRLSDGATLIQLSTEIGVGRSILDYWLRADPRRFARAREQRKQSSEAFEELAFNEITTAKTPLELAKAREMAHHYRWAAAVRSPATHGTKVEIAGNAERPLVDDATRAARAAQLLALAKQRAEDDTGDKGDT